MYPGRYASGSVPLHDYRSMMSSFPTGVSVITSVDVNGEPHGITCSSLASVTLAPPTLLVCIKERSPTLAALQTSRAFAVNLLHAGGRTAAEIFSSPVPDRFTKVRWTPSEGDGLPWLTSDAFAFADCELVDATPVGDHTVVIGQIFRLDRLPGRPLMYGMRRFSAWPESAAAISNGDHDD